MAPGLVILILVPVAALAVARGFGAVRGWALVFLLLSALGGWYWLGATAPAPALPPATRTRIAGTA